MTSIGIIGSGFGALAAAIEFTKHGHTDIRLWERAETLGGVWRDNTYPGAACDVPSAVYSFSFAPNPDWSSRYARQPEILNYLEHTAATYGLTDKVRFSRTVVAAHFDDSVRRWTVRFDDGSNENVDLLVSAVGQLSEPTMPAVPGVDSFGGISFHSARWDHGADLTGKRVAVIGTGASAIQFVPPLAELAASVTIFQRTPSYILPKPDQRYGPLYHWMLRRFPGLLRGERGLLWWVAEQFARGLDDDARTGVLVRRLALAHLRLRVRDPALRAALTPDYPIGCRRILFSNNYYPALSRPNVNVIGDGVTAVTTTGVIAAGVHHEVDAIVYGTGFEAQNFLSTIDIRGTGGQILKEQWAEGARAHLGIYVPNFPNLFIMYGPNTNLGGGSIVYMLEAQARHIRKTLDHLRSRGHRAARVTAAAEAAYDTAVQTRLGRSVWSHCSSWYRHPSGRITSNWPGNTRTYAERTRGFDATDFEWL